MGSELSKLAETNWLVVPIGFTLGGLLLGGLAALALGRIGEMLGFIVGGTPRSARAGCNTVSLMGGALPGALLGFLFGRMVTTLGPELLMTAYWAAIGAILGSFVFSRGRTRGGGARGEGMMSRASLVVAQSTGLDLETFLCMIVGTLIGLAGGIGFGVALSQAGGRSILIGIGLGALIGTLTGVVCGVIASQYGRVFRMTLGMIIGSALFGLLGSTVASLGTTSGEWLSGALTGGLVGGNWALILAERMFNQRQRTSDQP